MRPLFPLTSVKLKNFRAFKDLDFAPHPRLTVLFGRNASGKSTLLDAIAAGVSVVTEGLPGVEDSNSVALSRRDIRTSWEAGKVLTEHRLRIELKAQGDIAWQVLFQYIGRYPETDPSALADYRAQLAEALRTGDQEQVPLPVFAYYGVERAVDKEVKELVRPLEDDHELTRTGGIQSALVGAARFRTATRWLLSLYTQELKLRADRRDFNVTLPTMDAVRRCLLSAVQNDQGRCENPHFNAQLNRLLLDFVYGNGRKEELELAQLSDGFRTHLAMVLDLARRMLQCNPPPADGAERDGWGTRSYALVLIDEIDLHLHPSWQQTVLPALIEAFPNAQFLVTTHSEQVLSSVNDSAFSVYCLLRTDDGMALTIPLLPVHGARGQDILKLDMGVDERPSAVRNEYVKKLSDYMELVFQGAEKEEAALQLRQDLDQVRPNDPGLMAIDIELRRRRAIARRSGT